MSTLINPLADKMSIGQNVNAQNVNAQNVNGQKVN
jgi:hypothetical protein